MRSTSLFALLVAALAQPALAQDSQETPSGPSETEPIPVIPDRKPEKPAAKAPTTPEPEAAPVEVPTPDVPLASPEEAPELQPVADLERHRLVNGAPLHNPN